MSNSAARRPLTATDLWRMARVGAPTVAKDGSFAVFVVTRFDIDTNKSTKIIYRVALSPDGVAGGHAEPLALTSAETSSFDPALSADSKQLAFLRTPAGESQPQLYVMPLDGGEARKVTTLPMGVIEAKFLPDGQRMVVLASLLAEAPTVDGTKALLEVREKNPVKAHVTENRTYRYWDRWLTDESYPHFFLLDLQDGTLVDLERTARRWFDLMEPTGAFDVSPDGREIAFSANVTAPPYQTTRYAIHTLDIDGRSVTCVTPGTHGDDTKPRYSPDGTYLVYGRKQTWDGPADPVKLMCLERATGAVQALAPAWDRAPNGYCFADAETLVGTVDDDARSRPFSLRLDGSEPRVLACAGSMHGLAAAPSGVAYAQRDGLAMAPELVRIHWETGHVEALTHFNDSVMSTAALGDVEEIRFSGANEESVQMFVVRPPGFDPSKRYPLVHLIHGGPYGYFGETWHFRWNAQVFAAAGYVVAMVNFHGSASFGEAFGKSILGDWGGKPAVDILRATDLLVARPYIDESRMAIAGGSYGGYMTCWLATQTNRFACAVSHAAVFDMPGLYGGDVTYGLEHEIGGEPWGDAAARATIDRFDPAMHTEGYRTPMLVLHGEKDYRVPVHHGLQVYGVLQAKGVPARLVIYPDENHWILKPRNALHWTSEVLGWLGKYTSARSDP